MTTHKLPSTEESLTIKKKGNIKHLGKELSISGEAVNTTQPLNESESAVENALVDAGIQVIRKHHVAGMEFDWKTKGFAVLIELDGKIHDQYSKRLKDLRKDREASKRGFRVLRFSSDEPVSVVVADVKSVIGSLPKVPKEVWLVKYNLWMRLRDWVKSW